MIRSKSVLLIEEDASAHFMMRKIARALELRIDIAPDWREAATRLLVQPERYVLVLLNLDLCTNGTDEVIRSLRDNTRGSFRRIPVVAVVPSLDSYTSAICTELGLDGCVQNPITPVELLNLVDRHSVETAGPVS